MQDYRPIILGNMIYNIFSNLMVNKLKDALNMIIVDGKKCFVKGRNIMDASLTTHEIIHSM